MILYIYGAGRSGTTLLGIILNNLEGYVHYGELTRLPELKFKPRGAVGQEKVMFWSNVREELVRRCVDVEYDARFDGHLGWMYKTNDSYIKFNKELFQILGQQGVVVDSSKYLGRLVHLKRIYGERVVVLNIRRSSLGIYLSLRKKGIEQPGMSIVKSLLYIVWTRLSEKVVFFMYKSYRIGYEELIHEPREVLARFIDNQNVTCNFKNLSTGNIFDGNRLRMSDFISLRNDKFLFGIKISIESYEDLFQITEGRIRLISTVNAQYIVKYHGDKSFKALLSEFETTCDGVVPRLITKILYKVPISVISGSTACLRLVQLVPKGSRLFLLGGVPDSNMGSVKYYRSFGYVVEGDHSILDFESNSYQKIIHKILNFQPDIVLIGLGIGKQERVALDLKLAGSGSQFNVIGIGGSFDFISGRVRRSPEWISKFGLETFWRLFADFSFVRIQRIFTSLGIIKLIHK